MNWKGETGTPVRQSGDKIVECGETNIADDSGMHSWYEFFVPPSTGSFIDSGFL